MTEAALADTGALPFFKDVLACTGGTIDVSGEPGIAAGNVDAFLTAATAYLQWRQGAEEEVRRARLMPFEEATPAAFRVFREHREAVNRYFALCDVCRFDPTAAAEVRSTQQQWSGIGQVTLPELQARLRDRLPAEPGTEGVLPLAGERVNPFYRDWLQQLQQMVLAPRGMGQDDRLSQAQWRELEALFRPYETYQQQKPGAEVERLTVATLAGYLGGKEATIVREKIRANAGVAAKVQQVEALEKLLLYGQGLVRLVNNFVSFTELYDVNRRAMFERGAAVIDGRWFDLAVRVEDLASHAALAASGGMFVLYLEVEGRERRPGFTVALPATSGTKGNLAPGKRGLFFDIDGHEYDARIVRILENPISLREALTAPFVRLWEFVVGKIEAISLSSEKELLQNTESAMAGPERLAAAEQSGSAWSRLPGGPAGLFLGISVSLAALGSAFAFITKTLAGLTQQQALLGLAGAVAAVGTPVAFLALLKLQRQDLSALLEATGWAVNARMRLNRRLRRQFTRRGVYPADAEGIAPGARLRILLWLLVATALGCALLRSCG